MIQEFDNADDTRKSLIIDPAQAARDSLQAFVAVQYPEYQTNWHIRKIAIALKKVMTGEIKRLIIEAPPRHSKSLHVSQYFPPWYMGHNPTHEVMFVTYAQQFANKWGRKVRNIIASPEFRGIFDTRLAGDSKAANEFALVHGGEYHALGIDGQATGKGANCLAGETLIETTVGKIRIDSLYPLNYSVFTYDEKTKTIKTRRIKAFKKTRSSDIYRLVTSSGREIKTTGEHRFFTLESGYKTMDRIERGETLINYEHPNHLCVLSEKNIQESLQCQEINQAELQRVLLFGAVFTFTSCDKKPQAMFNVSKQSRDENSKILCGLQSKNAEDGSMSVLQSRIETESYKSKVLQQSMSERSSFKKDDGEQQFELSAWARIDIEFQQNENSDSSEGQRFLCGLQQYVTTNCDSSHRRKQNEQCSREFGYTVSEMPCDSSQIKYDTVSLVEKICGDEIEVYDIQVEGESNFFANGILVHNCAIIDDPYKNRKQAESYNYRAMVREFFNSALYTRLSPGGAIVVMLTRWHENDLISTLLEEDEFKADNWHRLTFPAVNESETEALWPARYDIERLMQIKKKIGLYNWNSLYLQRPSAREGNMFKRAWWRYYMRLPPKFDKIVQSWDFAFKDKKKTNEEKGSDFVVGQVWGKIGPDLYLIAQFRQQVDILRGAQALLKMTKDHPLSRIKLIEDKANGPATMQLLNKTIGGMVPVNPCQSKEERAEALKYLPEGGNVYLPHKSIASWIDSEFIDEWSVFPNGKHDDTVDAGTQAWEYLEGRNTNRLEKLLKM